jgi:hypothetical protein
MSTGEIKSQTGSALPVNSGNHNQYCYLILSALPGADARKELESGGIFLMNYVSGNTFVASVKPGSKAEAGKFNIISKRSVPYIDKQSAMLRHALATGEFPAFAKDEQGKAGITISYYSDIGLETVLQSIAGKGYTVSYSNSNSRRITLWLPVQEINSFTQEYYVAAAEIVSGPYTPDNLHNRNSVRCNVTAPDRSSSFAYNGAGVNVMLQDDAFIGPHIDFSGRIGGQFHTFVSGNHGDHCAGIIMGAGNKDPLARGMAWGANVFVYKVFNNEGFDSIYTHYALYGTVITSTSYSDGCNIAYTTLAQTLDQQMIDFPSLMHVFSAGNNGTADCGYGAGTGWGNITGGHKQSKNTISVGVADSTDLISALSSRGPAYDGRIKPELIADGVNVYSTSEFNSYELRSGSSMAAPSVSGTLAQLYQAYRLLNAGNDPPNALMRGVLLNSADDFGNAGPDFIYGFGKLNARRAMQIVLQQQHIDSVVSNAASVTHTISVPANTGRMRVMVCWTDVPAAVNATTALVNNLNITVTDPASVTYNPWVLNHTPNVASLTAPAQRAIDSLNPQEQVTITAPAAGNYTVTVAGASVPFGPQPYTLVWYFDPADEVVVTYPNGGEGLKPGETQMLCWDAFGNSGTFAIDYSTDSGLTWNTVAAAVSASARTLAWPVPNEFSGNSLLRVTRGSTSDVSDETFTISPLPTNITIPWSCPDSLLLHWTAVPGATAYDVFMQGPVYMDSLTTVTADSVIITNLNNTTDTYWFAVRARGPQNVVSRRTMAIEKTPGVFCPGTVDAKIGSVASPDPVYSNCMSNSAITVTVRVENPSPSVISNVPVSYQLSNLTPVAETTSGVIPSLGFVNYNFTTTLSLPGPGTHVLKVWTDYPADIDIQNDTFYYNIVVDATPVQNVPWIEDFESFTLCASTADCDVTLCPLSNGFINLGNGDVDDIDWRVFEGPTPSANTGPNTDFLPGTSTGNYMYIEASHCDFREGIFFTPCINIGTTTDPALIFYYHMFGSSTGSLRVDIFSNGTWTNNLFVRSGDQGNAWRQATVPLSSYAGQTVLFRFKVFTTNGSFGDIAVDAIQVLSTTGIEPERSITDIQVSPNPGLGLFQINASVTEPEVRIEVLDLAGRELQSQTVFSAAGQLNTVIDLAGFSAGTYLVRISTANRVGYCKIIKSE